LELGVERVKLATGPMKDALSAVMIGSGVTTGEAAVVALAQAPPESEGKEWVLAC
jgi:hypothetical protein